MPALGYPNKSELALSNLKRDSGMGNPRESSRGEVLAVASRWQEVLLVGSPAARKHKPDCVRGMYRESDTLRLPRERTFSRRSSLGNARKP